MIFQICCHVKSASMLMILYLQTVNTTKDAELFQTNINAVYEWSL